MEPQHLPLLPLGLRAETGQADLDTRVKDSCNSVSIPLGRFITIRLTEAKGQRLVLQ